MATKLRKLTYGGTTWFCEEKDGKLFVRKIQGQFKSDTMFVESDIEVIPPDSVGTEQIKKSAVIEDDLHDDVKSGLHELENQENYADHSDIDHIFGNASTSPTVPTQPMVVEEEEEP